MTWTIAVLAAATYCIIRGVIDLRERRYVWATIGIVCGALLLLTPIESRAIKFDLPIPVQR
jgi:hypothetical protein